MTIEELMQDIKQRLDAMKADFSEEKIRGMVTQYLSALDDNDPIVRKMRFGKNETPAPLIGTKYARWNLAIEDIEFLFDLQESLRGQKRVDSDAGGSMYEGPSEGLRNTWNAVSKAIYLPMETVREIDRKAIDNLFPRVPVSAFFGKDRELAARGAWQETQAYQAAMRAMDSAESGYGSQLVGAGYVRDLWTAARAESRLMGLIDTFEMTDPTVYLPVEVDIPELLFVGESTAANSSNYTTVKTGSNRVSVSAKKFVIHQMWSGELEEDSIIPFIPFLRRQAQLSLAHYGDSLVANGDDTNAATGNINLDDADPADTKHYLAFDAIRHAGLVDNTNNSKDMAGPITFAELRNVKARMLDTTYLHDWGHPNDPSDLIYAADPTTADQIATLDEVINWKIQAGQQLLNGQVSQVLGHPVIAAMAISKTEADGKVSTTGSNNVKGQVMSFNRRGAKWGWRRRVKLETERIPATDQTRLVYSMRAGLGRYTPTGAASGIEWADVIRDISL